MASSAAPNSSSAAAPKRAPGLMGNAKKYKHSFIQLFAMTGILILSVRSLSQKYRIHDLQEDTAALKEEHRTLSNRMALIKKQLLHEASLEPSGFFASRLRLLFRDHQQSLNGRKEAPCFGPPRIYNFFIKCWLLCCPSHPKDKFRDNIFYGFSISLTGRVRKATAEFGEVPINFFRRRPQALCN